MDRRTSDTLFTSSLIDVLEDVRRIEEFVAQPYSSEDRGKRSAMATLRNQIRQLAPRLEAAIVASRRIG